MFLLAVCLPKMHYCPPDPMHLDQLHYKLLFESLGLSHEEEHLLWGWLANNVTYREVAPLLKRLQEDRSLQAVL